VSAGDLRAANENEAGRAARLLVREGAARSEDEVREAWRRAPWRLQVTGQGEIATLERWREHSAALWVTGLWCSERRIGDLIRQLRGLATRQGFDTILSPIVPSSAQAPYEAAGMRVVEEGVTLARDLTTAGELMLPDSAGVSLRRADPSDVGLLLALDAECFDRFWRYDESRLADALARERGSIAESNGKPIGYTLCTVDRDLGVLGRLAVGPESRRQGAGTLLVRDAVQYLEARGVQRVTVSTQVHNAAARELYRQVGFTEAPEKWALLASDSDEVAEGPPQ
jgi:ribosomal protein S18 acetylase RimI-like enzyme